MNSFSTPQRFLYYKSYEKNASNFLEKMSQQGFFPLQIL